MPADPAHRRAVASRVGARLGLDPDHADEVLAAAFDVIAEELGAGRPVIIRGFGVFEPRHMKPVTRRKPDTGEPVEVPAKTKPAFRASDALKKKVNHEH